MSLSVLRPPTKKKKKDNLGGFPVSQQAAEATVMFTWVTLDKTREAKTQEQIEANLIFGGCVCVCIMYIKGPVGGKCEHLDG